MASAGSIRATGKLTAPRVRRILLVRHGETDANRNSIVQGHSHTPLNELGHQQAQLLAQRLLSYRPAIDVLVSSDLLRAMQTAAPIAAALGLTVQPDSAWRERCYGIFEGKGPQERASLREQLKLGSDVPPPGAQTIENFRDGILKALDATAARYDDANCIAVVTHAGGVRAVTMTLAGDGPTEGHYTPCPNCSITEVLCRDGNGKNTFELGKVYDVQHLEKSQTTSRDSG